MNDIPLKHCPKCGKEFPATADYFHRDKRRRDGLFSWCKVCACANVQAQYRKDIEKSRAKERDRAKIFRQEQPEKRIEIQAKYRESHREQIHQREAIRRKNNPEREQQRHRRYQKKNRDKINAYRRRRKDLRHSEKLRYRAYKQGLPDTFRQEDWQFALNYFKGRCAVCGRQPGLFHTIAADHWIPLSDPRPDNPGTVATNIVPLCHDKKGGEGSCNNNKSHRDPVKWLQERYGRTEANRILERIQAYFDSVKQHSDTHIQPTTEKTDQSTR